MTAAIEGDRAIEGDVEPAPLTPEEIDRVRANRCSHCGGAHARACPRVRRMAWHPNGNLAEVEFWPDDRWSDEHVIWPEDIIEPG